MSDRASTTLPTAALASHVQLTIFGAVLHIGTSSTTCGRDSELAAIYPVYIECAKHLESMQCVIIVSDLIPRRVTDLFHRLIR